MLFSPLLLKHDYIGQALALKFLDELPCIFKKAGLVKDLSFVDYALISWQPLSLCTLITKFSITCIYPEVVVSEK